MGSKHPQYLDWSLNCEQNFYWPPNVDRAHVCLKYFLYAFIEQLIISRFLIQLYTRLNNLKFEIEQFEIQNFKKFLGRGSPCPLPYPPDPYPSLSLALSLIQASPSNLKRFCPWFRTPLLPLISDSAWFQPPTFDPWLRPWKLASVEL